MMAVLALNWLLILLVPVLLSVVSTFCVSLISVAVIMSA